MIFKSLKTVVDTNNQFNDFQEVSLDFNTINSIEIQGDVVSHSVDIVQAMTPPEPQRIVDIRPVAPDAPVAPEAPLPEVAPEAPVDIAPEAPVDIFPLEIVQGQSVSVPNDVVSVEAPVVSTYYTEALSESFDSTNPAVHGPVAELIVNNWFSESVASVSTEQMTEANWESVISTPATESVDVASLEIVQGQSVSVPNDVVAVDVPLTARTGYDAMPEDIVDALPEAQVAFDVVPPAPVEPQVNVEVPEAPVEDIPVDVAVDVATEISPVEVVVVAVAPVQQYVEIAATPVYITPQVADAPVDAQVHVQEYVEIAATPIYITPDAPIKGDVINFAKGDPAVAHHEPIYCYFDFAKESAPQFSIAKGDAYVNSYVDSYVDVYSVRNDNDHLTKELVQVELVGVAQSTDVVADIAG